MAGSDTDSEANVSTLALNPPSDDESKSTTIAAPTEVHCRNRHRLTVFRPPYMCDANVTTPSTYGACIVRGVAFAYTVWSVQFLERPLPNTDKCLFQKLCEED